MMRFKKPYRLHFGLNKGVSMPDNIMEMIGDLEFQIDIMNESDLKGELDDNEYEELKRMKIKLAEMLEAMNEL